MLQSVLYAQKPWLKMVKLPQESSGGNVSDSAHVLKSAVDQIWPDTSIQRCTFHAFNQVRKKTTLFPRLAAGKELLGIARTLLKVESEQQALAWLRSYFGGAIYIQNVRLGQRTFLKLCQQMMT